MNSCLDYWERKEKKIRVLHERSEAYCDFDVIFISVLVLGLYLYNICIYQIIVPVLGGLVQSCIHNYFLFVVVNVEFTCVHFSHPCCNRKTTNLQSPALLRKTFIYCNFLIHLPHCFSYLHLWTRHWISINNNYYVSTNIWYLKLQFNIYLQKIYTYIHYFKKLNLGNEQKKN